MFSSLPPESVRTEQVFLSYSRTDRERASLLREALKGRGLSVFHDVESLRAGGKWMEELQKEIDSCSAFVVLIGCDGVRRWVGAETQAALNRHFGAHDDQRLPIFPILLGNTAPDTLPAFLRLFQATTWNGTDPLPAQLLDAIRDRAIVANMTLTIDGPPFVGLNAYLPDQAQLFFGRQKETLDALACFDTRAGHSTVRWLEINGNSGSGKSSLMNAGLLPLIDQGWLWPRTGYERWRRIGPLMPGEDPVQMLAEHLARSFGGMELTDVREQLERGDERALAEWLRTRKQSDHDAFLLAVDQFEELFTFADPKQRARFDCLLATALADSACPLFVISTVRADFLDRFEDLPRLRDVRNRLGKGWMLSAISGEGLREVIDGPARLADLDVSEVREAIVSEALDEPGALPLVENALHWLWEQRQKDPQSGKPRLSGKLFTAQGGLAGVLSRSADDLLKTLDKQRERALELLFRLVKVDPEGLRHTRRRIPLAEAVAVAGGGDVGRGLVNVLAGGRTRDGGKVHGPLRLITVTTSGRAAADVEAADPAGKGAGWVNLIHETLIRSKGSSTEGKPQPYWPTLWNYVDQHKERAAQREHLQLLARQWKERKGLARLFGLAGWLDLFGFRGLAALGSLEQRYLRWSAARALVTAGVVAVVAGVAGESVYWAKAQ